MSKLVAIRDKLAKKETIEPQEWQDAMEESPKLQDIVRDLQQKYKEELRVVENSEDEDEGDEEDVKSIEDNGKEELETAESYETNEEEIEIIEKSKKRKFRYIHGITVADFTNKEKVRKYNLEDMANSRIKDIYNHLELRQLQRRVEEKKDEITLQEIVYLRTLI